MNTGKRSYLGIIGIILGLALFYTGARFVLDMSAYYQGHEDLLSDDCAEATPSFDSAINAFHLLYIGDYRWRAIQEKGECLIYKTALETQNAGEFSRALIFFDDLITRHPGSLLVPPAQAHMREMLSGDPKSLAQELACSMWPRLLASAGMGPDTSAELVPELSYACAQLYVQKDDQLSAINTYVDLLTTYPQHPLAVSALKGVLNSPETCVLAARSELPEIVLTYRDQLANLYVRCLDHFTASGDNSSALSVYESFVDGYPQDPRAEEVKIKLARALIANVRAGAAGELGAPHKIGNGSGGKTDIEIQNGSPYYFWLILDGPAARIDKVERCGDCTTASPSHQDSCLEIGPKIRYVLPAGTYEVLITPVGSGTIPFSSIWSLESAQYHACFNFMRIEN